jgi:hypothetical protein
MNRAVTQPWRRRLAMPDHVKRGENQVLTDQTPRAAAQDSAVVADNFYPGDRVTDGRVHGDRSSPEDKNASTNGGNLRPQPERR